MKIFGVIPARYASTRFPGKPLALIHGKPMIQCVYEQAKKCKSLSGLVVATDDDRIVSAAQAFGGNAVMTSPDHPSGTDRCAEVLEMMPDIDVIINIQGDEPFIHPSQIELICECYNDPNVQITTLVKKITRQEELMNPSIVKTVMKENGEAMYYSRSPIPYMHGVSNNYWMAIGNYYKHLGIYGYRSGVLREIVALPVNELEKSESLEQLRWMANGYSIHNVITDMETISVDTAEDLVVANKFYSEP